MKNKLLLLILILLPFNVQADVAGCNDTTGMGAGGSGSRVIADAVQGVAFTVTTGGVLDSLTFLIDNNGMDADSVAPFMLVLYHLGAADTTAIDSSGTQIANNNSNVELYSFPAISGATIIADSSYLIIVHAEDIGGGVDLRTNFIVGTSLCPDFDDVIINNTQNLVWDGTVPTSAELGPYSSAAYYSGYITYTGESVGQIIMINNE
jgi:hypothetical protein